MIAVGFLPSLRDWLQRNFPNGLLLKMSPGFLIVETGKISNMSSKHWMTSGIGWRGEYWTQSISEHPSVVEESSLSQVIEATGPRESFLGTEHLQKWLERREGKSIPLPPSLDVAFKMQISSLSNTPPSDESPTQGHKQRDTGTTEKRTPSTPVEAQMLYVRRMTASEYETLQGFPENWTLVD